MQTEEEAFEQAFHNLPSAAERTRKSPDQLAILMSQQQPGSPAYILLAHELNMRLAKVQSNATERAAWVGVVGVVAGIVLTTLLQGIAASTPKEETAKATNSIEPKQAAPLAPKQ